ncbi:NADH-quinone oxidoreductase subunit C [Ideonella sp.]|uniref:hydrogenase large subunit n=1 Tax=Ideonella sp. TaxID=1929293 RepID=UPI0035B2B4D7
MGPFESTVLAPARELATLPLAGWAEACTQALDAGGRLVALFGRPDGDEIVVTTVLQSAGAGLSLLRSRAPRGAGYPSITARHPAAQMPERELWEQTGLVPEGHPWLKPVRFEGPGAPRMADYPFFTVRGQETHEVGVGPIHASVIEPGHFRFMCHGERVQHLEIQLGYQHRGVEALLLTRPPLALTSLVETIAGDSSVAYAWGYCAAVEALAGVPVAPEVELVRGVALELERIAMHLAALTGMATDIAFLQGGASYGRLRTAIINATMRVCGSRFGRGWLRPGGVRHGLGDAHRRALLGMLSAFAKDFAEVNALMLGARSVRSRLQGTGILTPLAARELGLVGLTARASGVATDSRHDLPGRLYTEQPVALLTEDTGDCWARLRLRMREIDESVRWLQQALESPAAALCADTLVPLGPLEPDTLCVTVREGFRGPVLQALETDAHGRLLHYKLQDPSLLNWFGLALATRDNEISDFPICNKSFDLSYCGNDL